MDFAKLKEIIEDGLPFNKLLGIRVEELREGLVTLRVPFKPELVGDPRRPALHGGVLSSLVDVCGGFAVWTSCHLEDRIATIDLSVDYLAPCPGPGPLRPGHGAPFGQPRGQRTCGAVERGRRSAANGSARGRGPGGLQHTARQIIALEHANDTGRVPPGLFSFRCRQLGSKRPFFGLALVALPAFERPLALCAVAVLAELVVGRHQGGHLVVRRGLRHVAV